MTEKPLVPLALAAMALGDSREITLRRLLRGELAGAQRAGKWLVTEASIEALAMSRAPRAA